MEDFGLAVCVPRFHNVYGPFGTYAGGREKAPAAACRKVIEAQLNGTNALEIWGDGQQTRSFTYIDDTIEGVLRLMEKRVTEPINLGSSQLVTINRLYDIVEEIAGTQVERKHDLTAPQGVRGRNSDNALILEKLEWEPSVSLEDGLAKTYAWIYEQMTSGRADEAALEYA
jgi:nucleoside-diphosphate-sugar epimerase